VVLVVLLVLCGRFVLMALEVLCFRLGLEHRFLQGRLVLLLCLPDLVLLGILHGQVLLVLRQDQVLHWLLEVLGVR